MRRRATAWLMTMGGLAGCRSGPPAGHVNASGAPAANLAASRSGIPVVTVTATEYAFQAPRTLAAGLTTFELVNRGHELHMLGLTRLEGGHTIAELLPILARNEPQPAWAVDVGGPNAVPPGDTSNSTTVLLPGRYALICWVPAADGTMHALKGMTSPLEVTGTARAAPEPTPDVLITLADYHIDVSGHPTAGRHVIRVENRGPHEHDVEILRLVPGHTVDETLRWFNEGALEPGVPPARILGGIVGMPPGGHGFVDADLEPGTYVLLCLVPDEKDGKAHYRGHGMVQAISVS